MIPGFPGFLGFFQGIQKNLNLQTMYSVIVSERPEKT